MTGGERFAARHGWTRAELRAEIARVKRERVDVQNRQRRDARDYFDGRRVPAEPCLERT